MNAPAVGLWSGKVAFVAVVCLFRSRLPLLNSHSHVLSQLDLQMALAALTSLSAVPWLSPRILLVLPPASLVRGGFQVRSPVARL